jgi:hypothetical protein
MALTLIPSDLVEQAARDENWTDADRRHCSRMLHQAFEESFQVKEIQRTPDGLSAYDAPFASFESVRFQEGARSRSYRRSKICRRNCGWRSRTDRPEPVGCVD